MRGVNRCCLPSVPRRFTSGSMSALKFTAAMSAVLVGSAQAFAVSCAMLNLACFIYRHMYACIMCDHVCCSCFLFPPSTQHTAHSLCFYIVVPGVSFSSRTRQAQFTASTANARGDMAFELAWRQRIVVYDVGYARTISRPYFQTLTYRLKYENACS